MTDQDRKEEQVEQDRMKERLISAAAAIERAAKIIRKEAKLIGLRPT